ncbi:MAG: penicillin-binding protein 2 [Pseudomonadota bacterium]|jgi:penicillin-binding protein 2
MKRPIPIRNIQQEQAIFRRRIWFSSAVVVFGLLSLVARYAFLQVAQFDHFRTESDNNRIKLQAVPPTRGYIYDRNGILLADNHPVFTAVVNHEDQQQIEASLRILTSVLELTPDDLEKFASRMKRAQALDQVALKIDLTEAQIARFSERKQEFPGVSIQTKMTRFYPHGELFAHVIGYVGRINDKEAASIDKVAYAGTDLIGKIGIEKYYEDLLHGTPGYQYVEADAHGQVQRQLGRTDAKRGNDLYLSIDYGLQRVAHEQLAGRRGAIVALDPHTGEILAFASNPSFDPNPFIAGISSKSYAQLRDNLDQPLYNRALQGLYPPGSTIKPFEGMGGAHYGLVDWQSRVYDPGYFHLPGDSHRFRDWKKTGHGVVNMDKAIAQSCDIYFYVLGYRMGIDRMHAWMTQFGFGSKTGVDLPGEKGGLYPSADWKMKRRGKNWLPGETISVSIGQGYFTATPLQVALATAIMANRGYHLRPHLLRETRGPLHVPIANVPDGKIPYNGDANDWLRMRESMKLVVNGGTASGLRRGLHGYEIAGKTGTAQVKSIAQGKRYNESTLTDRQYDHAWFMGFAPADDPKIAVAVLIENGKHGSSTAGPVARALFDYAVHRMDKDPIKPDPTNQHQTEPNAHPAVNPPSSSPTTTQAASTGVLE